MSFFDFDDNHDYEETRRLKLGEETLPPWREKLRAQFSKRFKVKFINVVYKLLKPGTPTKPGTPAELPHLIAIVELQKNWMRIRKESGMLKYYIRKSMIKQLSEVVQEFGLEQQVVLEKLFVGSKCFEGENITHQVAQFFKHDRDELLNQFSSAGVWGIKGLFDQYQPVVVFFETDEIKQRALRNGVADGIQQACYDRVKQYDEFGYLTPEKVEIKIDTKQHLDEDFQGSLFYYFH